MNLCKKYLFFLFLISFFSCDYKKEILISGKTMGTYYNIRAVTGFFENSNKLKLLIESRLKEINKSMSTYDPESEISKFNNFENSEFEFPISNDFYNVLCKSKTLYRITSGAWDGTIKPLVNLWGFGNTKEDFKIPEKKKIDELLKNIGFNNIYLTKNSLKKLNKRLSINLASIAKGYGVDEICKLLQRKKIINYLVEIGGEVYASGTKKDGSPWRIGINNPIKNTSLSDIYKVILLKNNAIATSGDYRNFFEKNNITYSHIIDPRSGFPVNNKIVSVSVIAKECMLADGLATALMVMGVDNALKLINTTDNVECMIITKEKNHKFNDYYSYGFKNFIDR